MKTISLTKSFLIKCFLTGMLLFTGRLAFAQLIANFSSTTVNGCAPILVQFNDESAGQPTSWKWDLGNGTISYLQHPSATYFTPGQYQIKLVAKNQSGQDSITKINFITVYASPVAQFIADRLTGCGSVASNFTAQGNTSIANWQWDFGDGVLSSQQQPAHLYTQPGNYNVTLTLTNTNGCMATVLKPAYITVNDVSANFIAAAERGCNTQKILFKQTANGNGQLSYKWYFGDGDSSALPEPSYTYSTGGLYAVKLLVSNQYGCADSISKNITVIATANAGFTADVTSACAAPVAIRFTNQQPSDNTYLWDFGDSTFSTGASPTHQYADTGTYHVKLIAKNTLGCYDSLVRKNYIIINKPFISLINLPDSGCIGFEKRFAADISSRIANNTYQWSFGDGTSSGSPTPSHQYTMPGYHTVTLVVTNGEGCRDTAAMRQAIRIGSKPVANFVADIRNACASEKIGFTDLSTGTVTGWEWDFGDNNQSVDQHPKHVFTDTGFLSPRLIAYNGGCADTLQRNAYIYLKPAISRFKFDFTCGDPAFFSFANSSLGANRVVWDFGDGTSSSQFNVSHRYSDTGSYRVSLTSFNQESGCNYFQSKPLKVVKAQADFFTEATSICYGDSIRFTSTVSSADANRYTWDFGDGTRQSTQDGSVTHLYQQTGVYNVTLVIQNLVNCGDSLVKLNYITVRGPSARFTVASTEVCANSRVIFTDSSTAFNSNIKTWKWNFGDGRTAVQTAPPFEHQYSNRGNYQPAVTVTDAFGCSANFSLTTAIKVVKLDPVFRSSDSVYCLTSRSFFGAGYGEPGTSYQWFFGDGNTGTGQQIWHTYTAAGTYDLKMVITNTTGCSDSSVKRQFVTIAAAEAAFTMSDSFRSCPPLLVQFTNQSQNATETLWDFGDGTSTNLLNPSHAYSAAGYYVITLTVKGRGGCTRQAKRTIEVRGPKGYLQYGPLQMCQPGPVSFVAHTIDAVSLIWDFNDGTTTTGKDSLIAHTYHNAGRYTPKLLLSDANGCLVPIRGKDTINLVSLSARMNSPIQAICGNDSARFINTSASREPLQYVEWNFGDGTGIDSSQNPIHQFRTEGSFYPSLKITSVSGCTDSVRVSGPVSILPVPKILLQGDSTGCSPLPLLLTALVEGPLPVTGWHWDFGNGQTSSRQQPAVQQFQQAGNYAVTVMGTAANGCTTSLTKNIRAWERPVIAITGTGEVCLGQTTTLEATGAIQYRWGGMENINCSNCTAVEVKPLYNTVFHVTGTDANGCIGFDSIGIKVIEPFRLQAANTAICFGEMAILKASGAAEYNWSLHNGTVSFPGATPIVHPIATTVYRVTASDAKGCFADTAYTTVTVNALPLVNAGEDKRISSGNPVDLVPQLPADVESVRWYPTTEIFRNTANGIIVKPLISTEYTVKVTNSSGCVGEDKLWVTVVPGSVTIFLPNTFSPNFDGMNDVFYPRSAIGVLIARFKVFNRAGMPVFEKTNFTTNDISAGWTGNHKGLQLQPDTYMYAIEWLDADGKTVTETGNVSLLR